MYKKTIILVIFFAALAAFLPLNANIPITDPVESNYAQTAKEMVMSGNWLSPQIYGEYWFDKPIMIYWLIALGYKIFGIGEFAARLPSAVFSAASVAFAYWYTEKLFKNSKAAFFSSLVLATSLEFWVLARMVITDATLFFYTSVSVAVYYLGLRDSNPLYFGIAYIMAALAVLTKGPVGIVLPGLIVFAYIAITRHWRLLGKLWIIPGLALFLLVAGPWYYAMYLAHGRDFVDTFLGLHNYIRATVSEHPKDNVFYYYLVLFPLSLLPWTGVFFKSIVELIRKRQPAQTFLAVWLMVIIGFYSIMATKYPTYAFPATFPAAVLMGYTLAHDSSWRNRNHWLGLTIPAVLFFLILGLLPRFIPVIQTPVLLYSAVALGVITLSTIHYRGRLNTLPLAVACITVILTIIVTSTTLVPLAWSRSAKAVAQTIPKEGAVVGSYGEYMTSAVFYSGYAIPNLTSGQEKSDSGAWSGKYTMPTETISSFDARTHNDNKAYILMKAKDQTQIAIERKKQGYLPVISFSDITLYQKIILP